MNNNDSKELENRNYASYPDILDAHDLAHLLNIAMPKTYHLLRSGEIPCRRLGNEYRISKQAVINYLSNDDSPILLAQNETSSVSCD